MHARDVTPAPDDTTAWPRGIVGACGIVGTIGVTLVVASSVLNGPHGPTGSSIERDVMRLAPTGHAAAFFGGLTMGVGIALLLGAWLTLGLFLRRGAPLRPLFRCTIAWSVPMLIGPPLFSRDVYSYAAQGLMVRDHIDPYHHGPAALGSSHFLAPVSPIWMHTASPYGPLFLRLAAIAVHVAGGSIVAAALVLRSYEVLGVVLIAVSLPKLASAVGKDPARAVWLGVLNPLVLFHFIGGAHNDALMVGLLVAGLAAASNDRPLLGVLLCTLGATIKAPAAIAVVFIAVTAVRALPAGRRLRASLEYAGVSAGIFAGITAITGMSWGWISALSVPGTNRSLLTPTTFVAHWLSEPFGHYESILSLTRGLGQLCGLIGIAYLLWRAPRIGMARACGLALALLVAFGPIVLPWYALWGIVVLGAVGRRIERGFAIFASIILLCMVEPSGSSMPDSVLMGAVVVLSVVALAIAWRPVRRWIRKDLAATIDRYRRGEIVHLSTAMRSALPELTFLRPDAMEPPAA